MLSLKSSAKGGVGLFATETIPAGTRILTEAPLIAFPHPPTPVEILNAVTSLPLSDRQDYLSLTYAHYLDEIHTVREPDSLDIYTHDIDEVPTLSVLEGLDISPEKAKKIIAIFENNAFDIIGTVPGANGVGIFMQGTRINHSCLPNVSHQWNKQLKAKTFHALRDIEAGEELTIAYLLPFQARVGRQRYLLEKHGFVCECLACDQSTTFGKASERRRKEMQELHEQLVEIRMEDGGLRQEKVLCERLIKVAKEEGLLGWSVGEL